LRGSGAIRTVGAVFAFGFLIASAAAIVFFGMALRPMCMCAAPPPGWHAVTSTRTILVLVGPALVVFLIGEYLALAPVSRQRRLIGTGLALVLAAIAAAICATAFLGCCSEYAP
jgi:hypothetical protein